MAKQKAKTRDPLSTTAKERVLYAFGDVGINLVWILPSSFLTLYYTDSVGLSAGFVGTMMLICRIFDGISDVLMGMIIDKTHTRWGKARPWLLMVFPMLLSLLLVFYMPQGMSEKAQKVYAFVTYFVMAVISYTALYLAYHSLLPRFSLTSQDRSSVTVVRTIFSIVTNIVVSVMTTRLIGNFGGERSQKAWVLVVLLYGALAAVCLMITFFGIKEKMPEQTAESKESHRSLKREIRVLLSSKYFYIAIILFISFYIASGTAGINIYYARDVFGDENLYGIMSICSFGPMMFAMPFIPTMFKKYGKRNSMLVGVIISAVASLITLLNPKNTALFFILSVVRSVASAPVSCALFTLAGDIVDFNQYRHGIRTEGMATSINSIGSKLGTGFGSAILGWMLMWGHYDGALDIQSSTTQGYMIAVALIIPAVINVICAILLLFWDMDKYEPEVHAFMEKQGSHN